MTDPAIILGTFADMKIVKTRSIVQVVVEVPLEQGKEIVDAFGFPQPGAEIHVAVTRVQDDKKPQEPEQKTEKPKRPGRAFADIRPSEQAGILCNDEAFQWWACRNNPCPKSARNLILLDCRIESRKELDSNDVAHGRWDVMRARFRADTGRTTEQRGG